MPTVVEILNRARELAASEGQRLFETLESLEREQALTRDDDQQASQTWVERGPRQASICRLFGGDERRRNDGETNGAVCAGGQQGRFN
jgi:hypothetical protein